MVVRVDPSRCTGCGACIGVCAAGALDLAGGKITVDEEKCTGCGACVQSCGNGALELVADAVPVQSIPYVESPSVVELDAWPVPVSSPSPPVKRSSEGWLTAFGKAVGTVAALLIERRLDGGNTRGGVSRSPRNKGGGRMRRRRGR